MRYFTVSISNKTGTKYKNNVLNIGHTPGLVIKQRIKKNGLHSLTITPIPVFRNKLSRWIWRIKIKILSLFL